MSTNHKTLPIDAQSAASISKNGLRLGLVDTDDTQAFERWTQADNRGFYGEWLNEKDAAALMDAMRERRTTGVYDDSGADASTPIGTVNSWPVAMTVPGGSAIDVWGISSVTVAPTHRRKGIARALLEGELRTASALGMPFAALTVSEATIYSRFGFAPAAMAAELEIDTVRARWIGPAASGRVQYVPRQQLRNEATALIEQSRVLTPGEIRGWSQRWDSFFGLTSNTEKEGAKIRAVRYDDADGVPQGFALYTLKEHDSDYARHTVTLSHLLALTPDAYAGLWQHVLELDLVATVKAPLRSVDEPLIWQVVDQRAIATRVHDHLWLRILDVRASLAARTYSAPLDTVIEVTDDLGFAAGRYRLLIEGGTATIAATVDAAALTLSVNELSALYLGGVSANTLARAGRIIEHSAGAAAALDTAFRGPVAPWLSIWF